MGLFDLSDDDRARAAAHVKRAEALAAETGLPADTPLRQIRHVVVIGAGTMGGGIAMACANAGLQVTLVDADAAGLDRGLARLRDQYAGSVQRGKLSEAQMAERLARIHGSLAMAEAADADLFIEAVFEDLALKQRLFREIDAVARPSSPKASATRCAPSRRAAVRVRTPQSPARRPRAATRSSRRATSPRPGMASCRPTTSPRAA